MATTTLLTQDKIDALNRLAADPELNQIMRRVLPAERYEAVIWTEYLAYICTMCDHDCQCLALGFDAWRELVNA